MANYQPLTQQQYENAKNAGFSHEQIVANELQRKASFESSVSTSTGNAKKKTDVLRTAGNVANAVFPGKQVGEAIGTLGGYGVTAVKEKLGIAPKGATKAYDLSAPNPLQVGGDIVAGALSIAGFKGFGTTGSFLQRVAKTFGLGAGLGAAVSVSEGKDLKTTLKNAAVTGAVGASIPIVGAGLKVIGKEIQKMPARLVNSALGRTKAQIAADLTSKKGSDFTNFVISKKLGTADTLLNESTEGIEALNNQINASLGGAVRTTGGQKTVGINNFLDEIASIPEARGALLKRADVKNIIERLAPQTKKLLTKQSLTVAEANQLRQLVDKTLGDRAFLGAQLSSDKIILKKFADSLRERVKTLAPEGTRELFAEISNEIRFRDTILNKIAQKGGNQVISFGDLVSGGIGGLVGGGLPGAAVGIGVRRAAESVPGKLLGAKVLRAVSKLGPVIDEMTPAQQTAILILIADLIDFGGDPEQKN